MYYPCDAESARSPDAGSDAAARMTRRRTRDHGPRRLSSKPAHHRNRRYPAPLRRRLRAYARRASRAGRAARDERDSACRTAALGGHVGGLRRLRPRSASPTTPAATGIARSARVQARAKWLADRQAELLPVPYFHVVFTLPAPVGRDRVPEQGRSLHHPVQGGGRGPAQDRRRPAHARAPRSASSPYSIPGARRFTHHPHIHCVVPGGGPSPDGARWIALPAGVLPAGPRRSPGCFAGCSSRACKPRSKPAELGFFGASPHLADPAAFADRLASLRRVDWVVYAKRPFGGPEQVLAYLGRYTHRVAIANSRLVSARRTIRSPSAGRTTAITASPSS